MFNKVEIIKKINYLKLVLIIVLFFLVFVKFQYLPHVVVLFLFLSILSINYTKNNRPEIKKIIPIILFFIINTISLVYSSNIKSGFATIQTQLSLLIFPFLIYFDLPFYIKFKRTIKVSFLITSFISVIYLLVLFVYNGGLKKLIGLYGLENVFTLVRYLNISVEQHPSYISLGYLLSVIVIWNSLKSTHNVFLFLIKGFLISTLIFFITLLNSRAIFIAVLSVVIYYLLKYLRESKFIVKIIAVSVIIVLFIFSIKNTRFNGVLKNFKNASTIEQIDLRFSLWRNAMIAWKQAPVFGHGIGDSKDALIKVHKQRNIEEAVEYHYNAHNQFFETLLQTGLIGLIVLLSVFAIPLCQSIKKKQELLFLFLIITFICFVFESMLQRLTGVVFFSFWYSFLLLVYYPQEESFQASTQSLP